MTAPFVLKAAAVTQAFPFVISLVTWRRLPPSRRIIAAWSLIAVSSTIVSRLVIRGGGSNLWLGYIVQPAECALALGALMWWQTRDLGRQVFRVAIPLSLAAYLALVVLLEDTHTFSAVATPLYALVGLGGALFTLVARAIDENEALWRQDWFWITGGMALYFGALAVIMPVARLLIGSDVALMMRAYELYGLVGVVANLVITAGMLCPTPVPQRPSGASSLPSPSASASPSPPSPSR